MHLRDGFLVYRFIPLITEKFHCLVHFRKRSFTWICRKAIVTADEVGSLNGRDRKNLNVTKLFDLQPSSQGL